MQVNDIQKELTILHPVPGVVDLPIHLVSICSTWRDAARLCMNQSLVKRTQKNWAESIGVTNGYMSQVLNGTGEKPKSFNPDQLEELQLLAGNRGITQWMDMRSRGLLSHQSREARKQALLDELSALESTG